MVAKAPKNRGNTPRAAVGNGKEPMLTLFGDKKAPAEELEFTNQRTKSSLILDRAIEHELKHRRLDVRKIDLKKLRRTISNRLSAQRSRQKKASYIDHLEKNHANLEKKVALLRSRVKYYTAEKKELLEENDKLHNEVEIQTEEAKERDLKTEKILEEINTLHKLSGDHITLIFRDNYLYEMKTVPVFELQPYPGIEFYKKGLERLGESVVRWSDRAVEVHLPLPLPLPLPVPEPELKPEPELETISEEGGNNEGSVEEDDELWEGEEELWEEEDEDIDQFINFDAMLDGDLPGFFDN